MRTIAVLSFSILVAAILWVVVKRSDRTPVAPIGVVSQSNVHVQDELTAPEANRATPATLHEPKRVPVGDSASATSTATTSFPTGIGRCHVFGRLVDDLGAPLPNLTVRLHIQLLEADDLAAKTMQASKDSTTNARTSTDAGGRFSFAAPLPQPHWASLRVGSSESHEELKRIFGRFEASDSVPLALGENDLGDVVLPTCGGIEGRVVYHSGAPLEFATVEVMTIRPVDSVLRGHADKDGHFELQPVPVGSFRLEIRSRESVHLQNVDVHVERAVVTKLGDLVMPELPTISGIVVDERGAPVSGVKLLGFPNTSGEGAQATTRKDGTFTMPLPQSVAHEITIERAPGFEPWGRDAGETRKCFDPGTNDVRIELVHAQSMTFSVVDARSLDPIQRFGLRVDRKPPAGHRKNDDPQPIPLDDHTAGTVKLAATPGLFYVMVTAPGHAPFESDVRSDAGSPGRQTIALIKSAALRGRLSMGAEPLENAHLRFEKEWISRNAPPGQDLWRNDVDSYSGRRQELKSGAAGAFEVSDLAEGTYRLEIDGEGVARTILHDIRIPAQDVLDLGRIDVARAAELHVRFLTTPPDSPVGFSLWLDRDIERVVRVKNADGTFVFTSLLPGPHALVWSRQDSPSWSESDPDMRRFELAAGESREIVIDERATWCTLRVISTRASKPQSGMRIGAVMKGTGGAKDEYFDLGPTNAEGIATRAVKGGAKYDIRVWGTGDNELAEIHDLEVPPDGSLERTIEIRTGTLVIEMPGTFEIPEDGYLSLHLAGRAGGFVNLNARTTHSSVRRKSEPLWSSATVHFGEIAAGEYDGRVNFGEYRPDPTRVNASIGVDVRPPFEFTLKVEEDKEAKVVVP